jgi:glycosyltransferase involved in cell wall biosynthesis
MLKSPAVMPLALFGAMCILIGLGMYFAGLTISTLRWILPSGSAVPLATSLMWLSGAPTTLGLIFAALDFFLLLPEKRLRSRREDIPPIVNSQLTVVLTAYNDELSIAAAVEDFRAHPLVERVIVVDNNSRDGTAMAARAAGAEVVVEMQPGYGNCVYRCYQEALRYTNDLILLCEGDCTFRAADIDKFMAYARHAHIVNGTRIVEQLREMSTQLSTFMFYGNFFVGKLLELKHFGRGTFTDVGTTYKLLRRDSLLRLLPQLNPKVNLEFNAYFLDIALGAGERIVECPITFHARVGVSKGGNVNDARALKVGTRMILGLLSNWKGMA